MRNFYPAHSAAMKQVTTFRVLKGLCTALGAGHVRMARIRTRNLTGSRKKLVRGTRA